MPYEYREFTDDRDGAFRDCVLNALTIPLKAWPLLRDRIGRENLRVLVERSRLIGGMGLYRMGLWFGGRSVPSAGVTVVGITPDRRRQGAAFALLAESLREVQRSGEPIAALYPSSPTFYRRLGFEHAGNRAHYEFPLSHVRLADRELSVSPVSLDSPEPFLPLAAQRGRATNGNIDRTPGLWSRLLSLEDQPLFGYLIGETSAPEGFIIYYQEGRGTQPAQLIVRDMAALTPSAARRLWTFIGDHASIHGNVRWCGPANEPLLAIPAEPKFVSSEVIRWMLRIVRVEDALRARGYPATAEGELHLDVQDDLLPENSGRYVLQISDGTTAVERGGRGELRCDIRGLAPLYSSLFPATTLKQLGFLDGPPEAIAIAEKLVAGPEPWMPEIF